MTTESKEKQEIRTLNDLKNEVASSVIVGPKRFIPSKDTLANPIFGTVADTHEMALKFKRLNGWPKPKEGSL